MKLRCPKCMALLLPQNVDVRRDIAKCDACGEIYRITNLVADAEQKEQISPPAGSKITFTLDDNGAGVVVIPQTGINKDAAISLAFSGFMTAAVIFFLVMALLSDRRSIFPIIFALPFIAIGVFLFFSVIFFALERQEIHCCGEGIVLKRIRPLFPLSRFMRYDEIRDIQLTPPAARPISEAAGVTEMEKAKLIPTFETKTGRVTFGTNLSNAEKEWVVAFLRNIINRRRAANGG